MAQLLVLHGPNLDLLSTREPEVYGHTTLAEIDSDLKARAESAGHRVEHLQSNAEHVLIERIHAARMMPASPDQPPLSPYPVPCATRWPRCPFLHRNPPLDPTPANRSAAIAISRPGCLVVTVSRRIPTATPSLRDRGLGLPKTPADSKIPS